MRLHHFICAILAGMLAPLASAQFALQSPSPTGRSLGGVAFTSPTHGFIVGMNHHLLETFDAGATWVTRMSDDLSTDPFYTITFPDAMHGYLAGNNQDAYRTSDGGQTWTRMTSMLGGSVRVLDFVTPTTGFAGYNGAITWTPDGGQTWVVRGAYPDAPIVFGMDFRDASVGLAAGIRSTPHNDEGIYRTADGGVTWTLVDARVQNDVLWIDQQSAIAVAGTDVLRSDDEGQSWYVFSAGWLTTGLSDLDRAGATSTLTGVSGKGDIWVSFDMGQSWEQKVVGIGVLPADWAVTFHDSNTGMVVGDRGLTYRTQDGGHTWTLLNSGCGDEISDIEFFDNEFGLAVTRNAYVLRTQNHGQQWDVQHLSVTGQVFGRTEGLNAVEIVSPTTAFVGGAGGLLFRSDDAGQTWQSVGFPFGAISSTFEAADFQFVDPSNGWCVGFGLGDSNVYRTSDGGYSWAPVPNTGGVYVNVHAAGPVVNIATRGNAVLRTVNDGASWTLTYPAGNQYGFTGMGFANDNVGWLIGGYGYLAKTTNGGASWTPTQRASSESYSDIRVVSPTEVWVFGSDSSIPWGYLILHTTDGGTTWQRTLTTLPYAETMTEIEVSANGRRWIAGSFGKILHASAPPLRILLPAPIPVLVAPGVRTNIPVQILAGEDSIDMANTALWLQRTSGSPYEPITLTHVSGDDFLATLPPLRCTDTPRFYFAARGVAGSEVRLPSGAPGTTFSTRVGVSQTVDLLDTGFDTGLPSGWAVTGLWHIASACAPPGTCDIGNMAYFGQDSTCNFNLPTRVSGILRSPTVTLPTLQTGQNITLSFCSALDIEYPDNALGDNDQAQLWFVYSTGANPIEWLPDHSSARVRTYNLNQHAGRTGRLEWRFDSMNTYMNAFRGWHVDNIRLTAPGVVCTDPCRADFNADGSLDLFDYLDFVSSFAAGSVDADFNADTVVDFFDYLDFVAAFASGC